VLLEESQKEYRKLSWDGASEKIHGLYVQHMESVPA
jgi:hypothetical protein